MAVWLRSARQTARRADSDFFYPAIEGAWKLLASLGIEDSGGFSQDVKQTLDEVMSLRGGVWAGLFVVRADMLARDYSRIREGIFRELKNHKFLYLPGHGPKYFAQDRLFGDAVYEKFPSARHEVTEAGNALAFSLYSACVFHLMRVAEHGLRKLARRLDVRLTDKTSFLPLEYADWHKIITGIRGKIEAERKVSSGPRRQEKLEMYSNAADHCEYMKDIWRNTASHARKSYIESSDIRKTNDRSRSLQFDSLFANSPNCLATI
jgi:hypothetical protein